MTDKTFDLFGFLDGRTFPETTVKIYTDEQVALELKSVLDSDLTPAKLETKLKELRERADETALTFHLRGIPQSSIDDMLDEIGEEAGADLRALGFMSLTLWKVSRADGSADERKFSQDDVKRLFGLLPRQGVSKLIDSMYELILASTAYDQAADAGF